MAELLLLNPRRRRRRKMTAKQRKYFGKRGRRRPRVRVRVTRPRRSRRSAVIRVSANPRRRRYRRNAYVMNPRRRYRRNPALRMPTIRGVVDQVTQAGVGAAGATLVDVLMGFIAPRLPAALMNPTVYPLVKAGVAIGFGTIGASMGGQIGRFAAQGANGSLICTLRDVIRQYLPADLTLGWINSGYVPRRGMSAYVKGVRTPLMGTRTPLMGLGQGGEDVIQTAMEREMAMYGPGYVAGGMRGVSAYLN